MPDVSDVIEALGCLTTKQHKCGNCKYNPHPGMNWIYGCMAGQNNIVEDARKLLREIEPRILTLEEAEEADICFCEGRDIERVIPCRVHVYAKSITATIMKMIASPEDLFIEDYGREWRCWSARPSRRQREEAEWDV